MSSSEIALEPIVETVPTESVVVDIPIVEAPAPEPALAPEPAPEPAPAPVPTPLDPRAKDLAAPIISSINWTQPAPQVLRVAFEIEKIKDLTPGQKIKLAQDTFTYVSRETGLTPTEKETTEFFIEHVLPHIYSAVLYVASNPIVGAVKMSGCCY
jgi:hypothetical protein